MCLDTIDAQSKLYDLDHIVEIKINFAEEDWHEKLDSLKERGRDERLVADVIVDGKSYPQSGIRYKGNSSYFNVRNAGIRKLPFNIKVDFVVKKTRLPGGYVTLKLSNVFRDPSYLREVLSYDIAGKYMPAPRANFAKVYTNGDYLGLYNLTESVDDDFLKEYYGNDDGVFVKCDPSWHERPPVSCKAGNNASLEYLGTDSVCYYALYELKSDYGWKELISFTEMLKNKPEQLSQQMDVTETLWMLSYHNVLVNLDSYLGRLCHNYYMYQDTNQVWHSIIWDMNLSFGGFRYTGLGAPLSNEAMQDMSFFLHFKEDNQKRPLVLQLIANDHFRKIYLAQIRTIVEENFSNGWYMERAHEIREMINEEVAADKNKLYSIEAYEKNLSETVRIDNSSIIGISELMDARAAKILAHPLMQKTQPSIEDVDHDYSSGLATISAQVTDAMDVYVYYRSEPFGKWMRQPMADNENGKWIAQLTINQDTEYYLVAENKYIARLSPARAGKEVYEIEVPQS
jgi:spore coat protein CotH